MSLTHEERILDIKRRKERRAKYYQNWEEEHKEVRKEYFKKYNKNRKREDEDE